MEIEKGEYIKTCYGEIGIYIGKSLIKCKRKNQHIYEHEVKSHNFNIMKLLEERDRVNDCYIICKDPIKYIETGEIILGIQIDHEFFPLELWFGKVPITDIETHEQYDNNKYILEEYHGDM